MRIGLDYGGVIADEDRLKRELAQEGWNISLDRGSEFSREALVTQGLLTHRQYDLLQTSLYHSSDYGVDRLAPVGKSLFYIKRLQADGHDLNIVSRRDEEARRIGELWLKAHDAKIPFHTVGYPTRGSKGEKCSELGLEAYFDDDLDELIALPSVEHKFLFAGDNTQNQDIKTPENIKKVFSWAEFYDKIRKLS